MDNINVIRVGFFTPEFKIADTDGEIGEPIDRSGQYYTCLVFINPDDDGADLINMLESGLPKISTGLEVKLAAIVPAKPRIGKAFRQKAGFNTRLFCDSDLRAGKTFSVVDSASAKPAYHPVIFVIGEEGTVRHRQAYDTKEFNAEAFRTSISQLI